MGKMSKCIIIVVFITVIVLKILELLININAL